MYLLTRIVTYYFYFSIYPLVVNRWCRLHSNRFQSSYSFFSGVIYIHSFFIHISVTRIIIITAQSAHDISPGHCQH